MYAAVSEAGHHQPEADKLRVLHAEPDLLLCFT